MSDRDQDRTAIIVVPEARGRATTNPPILPSARLVCVIGRGVGGVHPITGAEPVLIGRGDDVDVLLEGPEISRHHAVVKRNRDQFVLTDLGSRNGTMVNGERISERALAAGDRIELGGSTVLVFALDDELQRRALRVGRLENLATIVGGVVHDFRNTLGAVMMNVELLQMHLGERHADVETLSMLKDVMTSAQAGLETSRRLLYFTERQAGTGWTTFDLATLLDEVLAFARRPLTTKRIQVTATSDPGLSVRGDRNELHHAIFNLAVNARDAMPSGGSLSVTAIDVPLSRSEALQLHLPLEGRYAQIDVVDTGTGMDAATQSRAFEPFFTTKPAGEGTGLGLSTVYGIVRRHGGNVLVESTLGAGTRMRILLPAA